MKFILILMLAILLLGCSSTPTVVGKLDLTAEKQLILDSIDIPETKKQFIVNTFDKAEAFCNDTVALVNSLYKTIDKQKAEIVKLDEQAGRYRFWRNILIGLCAAFVLYELRGFILPIVKRLIGIPV